MATEAKMLRNYCAVKLSILYAGSHVCVIERDAFWAKFTLQGKSKRNFSYEIDIESDI